MKFKIGDKVVVIKERYPASQYLGQVGKIVSSPMGDYRFDFVEWPDGEIYGYENGAALLGPFYDPNELLKEIL